MRLFPLSFVPIRTLWIDGKTSKLHSVGAWRFQVVLKEWRLDWRDWWIGLYWDRRSEESEEVEQGRYFGRFEVYACLIPCLPIHIIFDVFGPFHEPDSGK